MVVKVNINFIYLTQIYNHIFCISKTSLHIQDAK